MLAVGKLFYFIAVKAQRGFNLNVRKGIFPVILPAGILIVRIATNLPGDFFTPLTVFSKSIFFFIALLPYHSIFSTGVGLGLRDIFATLLFFILITRSAMGVIA